MQRTSGGFFVIVGVKRSKVSSCPSLRANTTLGKRITAQAYRSVWDPVAVRPENPYPFGKPMNAILKGASLVWTRPELRRYIWRPLVRGVVWSAGFVALSFFLFRPFLDGYLQSLGVLGGWASGLSWILVAVIWFFILGPAFHVIAITASAMEWEKLSLEVEKLVHGPNVPNRRLGALAALSENGKRLPRGLATAMVCGLLAPIFLGLVSAFIAGWQCRYDYTAPAFIRRGVVWPQQKALAAKLPGINSFHAVGGISALIPIVNLLMIPALIAGGTLLTAERYPHEI